MSKIIIQYFWQFKPFHNWPELTLWNGVVIKIKKFNTCDGE